MTNSEDTVLFERHGAVAWLTLNRPEVHNAINLATRDRLWTLLDVVEADDEIGCAVFTGAGASFSSGADLTDFGTAPSLTESRRARFDRDLWGRLLNFEKPFIAAIHGYALGGGLELALCCDIRLATEDAILGLPETGIGYVPSAGGTQTLPRLIGIGRALDLILTAEPISATRALDFGLVNEVITRDQLLPRAEALSQQLAALDQVPVALIKRRSREGINLPIDEAIQLKALLAALGQDEART